VKEKREGEREREREVTEKKSSSDDSTPTIFVILFRRLFSQTKTKKKEELARVTRASQASGVIGIGLSGPQWPLSLP
jgi:hypothetical protein